MRGPFDFIFGPSKGKPRTFNPFGRKPKQDKREERILAVMREKHCKRKVAAVIVSGK